MLGGIKFISRKKGIIKKLLQKVFKVSEPLPKEFTINITAEELLEEYKAQATVFNPYLRR